MYIGVKELSLVVVIIIAVVVVVVVVGGGCGGRRVEERLTIGKKAFFGLNTGIYDIPCGGNGVRCEIYIGPSE